MNAPNISWQKIWRPGWSLAFVLYLMPALVWAQQPSFLFDIQGSAEKGASYYAGGEYQAAIPYLEQALKSAKHHQAISLKEKLATAYANTGLAQEAVILFDEIAEKQPLQKEQQLWYANSLMAAGRQEDGHLAFMALKGMEMKDQKTSPLSAEAAFNSFFRDSIRYSLRPVPINTEASEYSPLIVGDGILFVSDKVRSGALKMRFTADESQGHDLYYVKLKGKEKPAQPVLLNNLVNTKMPEGPASVYKGHKNIIFTRSTDSGMMQLFQGRTTINHDSWVNVEQVTLPVKGSVGHPAISEDGKLLYFVSDMPGGYGGTDIYCIEKADSSWGAPRNLGPLVNTAGNEMFPNLHGYGRLFFASNGHYGLGGLDIYEARLEQDKVLKVWNMGYPINSSADDFSLSLHESGHWGYICSTRAGGAGKDDVYRLEVNIITLQGVVYDQTNGQRVGGTLVQLKQEDSLLAQVYTDAAGNYSFDLFPGQQYTLTMEADEYRPEQQQVSTLQGPRKGMIKMETGLERKVKMFVLGTIRKTGKDPAAAASMLVIDQADGNIIDTVYTDRKGNYEVELDTESAYTFWIACEGEGAVLDFTTPEKGKASLSYYQNINLQQAKYYKVKGKLKSATQGSKVLSLTNSHTLEQEYIFTDEQGNFSFEAYSLADYELCLPEGDAAAVLQLAAPWHKPERMVEMRF